MLLKKVTGELEGGRTGVTSLASPTFAVSYIIQIDFFELIWEEGGGGGPRRSPLKKSGCWYRMASLAGDPSETCLWGVCSSWMSSSCFDDPLPPYHPGFGWSHRSCSTSSRAPWPCSTRPARPANQAFRPRTKGNPWHACWELITCYTARAPEVVPGDRPLAYRLLTACHWCWSDWSSLPRWPFPTYFTYFPKVSSMSLRVWRSVLSSFCLTVCHSVCLPVCMSVRYESV